MHPHSHFLWLKVPFGLLFGLTIGIMALVPFGGTVGIVITTLWWRFKMSGWVLIAGTCPASARNLVAPEF